MAFPLGSPERTPTRHGFESGALTYRSQPINNQASSRSRGQGNLGGATNPITGTFSLNTGPVGNANVAGGGSVSPGIRTFGSNFFGSANGNSGFGYGNSGYGYGNAGYGYGNGGSGFGRYGNGNSGYVMVYLPGVGWVMVPIRAIRGF